MHNIGDKMVDDALRATGNEVRAPFMSHLKELRNRILYSAIALGLSLLVGMFFGSPIIRILKRPSGNMQLITMTLMEPMFAYFRVSILTAVVIAMPFLVYQFLAFVAPGLTVKEKRVVFTALPAITLMFLLGVAFAYFIVL